eukprot:scaffold1447_cov165-Ochromonas_danica.AAC.1
MPKKKKRPISEAETSMLDMGQAVLSHCFHLLHNTILGCPENQMYVADFMPVLLAHLNAQPLAGKCVTEMLSKNMELQETKIGTREIQIFVDKLRSSKMNAMYLQLLQACCSCEGNGVDGNQCKVANLLFSNTNDIIIEVRVEVAKTKDVHWTTGIYIPHDPLPASPVRGEQTIRKSVPQLSLAWTTNSIDFSPLGLFGKLSVYIEDLFGIDRDKGDEVEIGGDSAFMEKRLQAKKAHAEQKNAVANYFIAQMFLAAEMCLDRNYIAMNKLDKLFPYDVLVTMLVLDVTNNLKAAAIRLLMCLYVDRDPQASSRIPCLTRTWSEIEKNSIPQLPFVDSGRQNTFGFIQQFVSDHIKDMAGSKWDELSRHVLKMLRTLIEFNFYGNNERMSDVIGPLIEALDRRKMGKKRKKSFLSSSSKKHSLVNMLPQGSLSGSEKVVPLKEATDLIPDEDDLLEDSELTQPQFETSFLSTLWNSLSVIFGGNGRYAPILPEKDGKEEENGTVYTQDDEVVGGEDNHEGSSHGGTKESYQVPARYSKAPMFELETMVEAVDILAFGQKVIEDRNISLLLRNFHAWYTGLDRRSPSELFEQVVNDSHELSMHIGEFDNVMIDILMYEHTALVQSTLEVLMAHHSLKKTLLENAHNIQLLASHPRERQYRIVDQMLKQLEQNAETHELWGELETESDHA